LYKGDKPEMQQPDTDHPTHDDRQLAGRCRTRQETRRERPLGGRDVITCAMLRARQRRLPASGMFRLASEA